MDKKRAIAKIVKENLEAGWSRAYYYPDIRNKNVSKVVKYFDPAMDTNSIAAIIDMSLLLNHSEGFVFTSQGAYYKQIFEKSFYFNYVDIVDMKAWKVKKNDGILNINLNCNHTITIKYTAQIVFSIKKTLELLKNKSLEDKLYTTKKAGYITTKAKIPSHIKKECHAIIHSAATLAGGVGTGLAQIPLADNAAIAPIQVSMIIALGKVFGLRITEGIANGVIASCAATIAGRGVTQVLWGWIPVLGNAINTATAAGLTEAIGWVAAKQFYLLQQDDIAKHRMRGMKAGYEAASAEYEIKLRELAQQFISQQNIKKENLDRYNELCDEYLQHIIALESRLSKTEEENQKLREMQKEYEKLVNCHVEEA